MRLGTLPLILRIHSSKKKKENEGIFSELLLFSPWTDEQNLRKDTQKKFNDNFDVIKVNKQSIYPNSSMVDVLRELIENPEDARPKHLGDIDTTGQQENADDVEDMLPIDTTKLPDEEPEPSKIQKNKADGCLFKPVIVDEEDIMLKLARSLSYEQLL